MLAVLKKELKTYLVTPIGYIFIGVFLLIFSLFFYITIIMPRAVNFEYLFLNGATILTFVVPVITMKMFSEERKSGTEQLLLTSPRSIVSIVLGKFFAGAIIIAITEVFTLMYFFILKYFGHPSLQVAISTLAGFFLLSLAYLSLGMFVSSITENQIVAFVVTVGAFLAMWFLPDALPIFEVFSLIYKFQNFSIGIVSLSEIITFVSFILLFVLLTIIVLQRRKSGK